MQFGPVGRALIMARNKGILRVYAETASGKLIGAAMIAPKGENLGHLLAWSIQQELTVFVPTDDDGGAPIKLQKLQLRNDSARRRRLSITYYAEWTLGESRESSQMHVVTSWDDEAQALLARNRYHPDYGERVAFAAMSPPAESYSGDRTAFLGRNRVMADPAAMEYAELSRRIGAGFDQDRIDLCASAPEHQEADACHY